MRESVLAPRFYAARVISGQAISELRPMSGFTLKADIARCQPLARPLSAKERTRLRGSALRARAERVAAME